MSGGQPFLPQEIIRKKRDGGTLADAEIAAFVAGLTDGSVGDGQAAAFAMAVLFRGLDGAERVALTRAMTRSGTVLDWTSERLPGPVLDKHSTGGVGDKVSLVLAPVIAACGGFVPMVSGRGLGHTGGTLDKMDAIPGYVSQPDLARLRAVVRQAGCAVVGATGDIAPADRRLYAIRDVTATVESLDLIVASILSKKLAAGLQGLVMDVKTGSGAFMPERERADALARAIVSVAEGAGLPTVALLTDMDQVLGTTAGNAVELREAIDMLRGERGESRLRAVTWELCAEMLLLGGLAATLPEARSRVEDALAGGAAAERFARMVALLGGPADLLERPERHLPAAPVTVEVHAAEDGYVSGQDVRGLGLSVVALGGGRTRPGDGVDHRVGLTDVAAIGTQVGPGGTPLCRLHAADAETAAALADRVRTCFHLDGAPPAPTPVLLGRVSERA